MTSTCRLVPAQSTTRPSVPQLLDSVALADRLGITPRHVRRLVAERRIPFVKVGRFVRFDPEEVVSWLSQRTVGALR